MVVRPIAGLPMRRMPRHSKCSFQRYRRGYGWLAIFATVPRAFPDPCARPCVHDSRGDSRHLPGQSLEKGDKLVGSNIAFVFGLLRFGQAPFGGLLGQLLNPSLEFRVTVTLFVVYYLCAE